MKILVESTPNPNANRFIVNQKIKKEGDVSFHKGKLSGIMLIDKLLEIKGIDNVYILNNFITITKDNEVLWDNITIKINKILEIYLPKHNNDFSVATEKKIYRSEVKEDIEKINSIIDRHIRSSLNSDGGDIEIIDLNGNLLTIKYKGSCSSCPSSSYGTLLAIEDLLREEFNSNLEVKVEGEDDKLEDFFF